MNQQTLKQKVAKQYKEQINSLRSENYKLRERVVELEKENRKLKRQLLHKMNSRDADINTSLESLYRRLNEEIFKQV